MSPDEVQQASAVLDMDPRDFVKAYASHTLQDRDGKEWIRLHEVNNDEDDSFACVFLENNQCSIYNARPVQCRTYPFWPSILVDEESWNDECRRQDDDMISPLEPWSQESGGCEGMKPLGEGNNEGVSIQQAMEQLHEYELSDRRFPFQAEEIPVRLHE